MFELKTQNLGSNNTRKQLKKKGFLIDKITEDSFFENLLLGLTTSLRACQFVSQISLERFPPATLEELCIWEYNNYTRLPDDLRNFYMSSNGFAFSYRFQYDKDDPDTVCFALGDISINPLSKLEHMTAEETWYMTEYGTKVMIPHTKIFLLAGLEDNSYVVLANFNSMRPLSFWLYYKSKNFFYLCEDFKTYFRMALAYLGIPGWQLAVLNASPPEWGVEMFQILAPGVLHSRQMCDNHSEDNEIDPSIFIELESPLEPPLLPVAEHETKRKSTKIKSGRKK